MNLDGKVIIVVGCSGLLGNAIVKSILESGGRVVAADISISNMVSEYGNEDENIILEKVDITKKTSIENLISTAEEKFGAVHGAVNAAYPRNKNYGKSYLDVTFEDFSENMSMHLGGYFLFTQSCLRYSLIKEQEFSMVNISSIYGVIAPRFEVYEGTEMTMPVEYAAIKSALIHIDKYVANFAKNSKFRINDVSPGGIFDGQNQSFVEKYAKYCRNSRMLFVEEVTDTIIFLLSEKSKMISAQNIVIDDGFTN